MWDCFVRVRPRPMYLIRALVSNEPGRIAFGQVP